MKIRIINECYTETTRAPNPDDSWDRGSTDTSNSIQGIRLITNEKNYYDLDTEFDIKTGKTYYLVYAEYTTGDSFGSDSGRIEFIQLYRTLEKAKACIEALTKQPDKNTKTGNYSTVIITESGKKLIYGKPWVGYFESLETLDIAYVSLEDEKVNQRT